MNFIVTYDIRCNNRLRGVFRICTNCGMHLQYAVFDCDLTATDKLGREGCLKEVINEAGEESSSSNSRPLINYRGEP